MQQLMSDEGPHKMPRLKHNRTLSGIELQQLRPHKDYEGGKRLPRR